MEKGEVWRALGDFLQAYGSTVLIFNGNFGLKCLDTLRWGS